MPNPFNLSDSPDLTDKSIQKVKLNKMALHHHTLAERKKIKAKKNKRKRIKTSDGYTYR